MIKSIQWRVTKVGGQSRDFQIVTVDTGGFIAQASSKKNAELIATAPDLRAALEHLYQTYVVDMHGARTCDCDPSVGIDTCAPCEARAALRISEEP